MITNHFERQPFHRLSNPAYWPQQSPVFIQFDRSILPGFSPTSRRFLADLIRADAFRPFCILILINFRSTSPCVCSSASSMPLGSDLLGICSTELQMEAFEI